MSPSFTESYRTLVKDTVGRIPDLQVRWVWRDFDRHVRGSWEELVTAQKGDIHGHLGEPLRDMERNGSMNVQRLDEWARSDKARW